ncbi:MAG: alpha/beta hydrolase family esterase [Bradymonadia bacterium]
MRPHTWIFLSCYSFLLASCEDSRGQNEPSSPDIQFVQDIAMPDGSLPDARDMRHTVDGHFDIGTDAGPDASANTDSEVADADVTQSLTPGEHAFTIQTEDGRTRRYIVHVPGGLVPRPPVVLVLHGGGGSAAGAKNEYGFDETANAHGFLAVYPEGIDSRSNITNGPSATWNGGACCGDASAMNVDDVGFIRQLLDDLAERQSFDTKRVYATGFSNGGSMSHRLACELSERIAAVAPVGAPFEEIPCTPPRSVAILFVHGTDDRCARFDGGAVCGGCFQRIIGSPEAGTYPCVSIASGVERWRALNQCEDDAVETYQNGAATCRAWACRDNTAVGFCEIMGMGHHFPGTSDFPFCERPRSRLCMNAMRELGMPNSDFNNDQLWLFLSEHRQP